MSRALCIALLAWLATGAMAATNFTFVVIGDTRPRFESENFRTFEALIPRINAARPDCIINLGDLIYGYGVLRKEKQWDRYQQVIKKLEAPYYQVPGNHDIYSKTAREIYRRRFGKFYESFDRNGCHFVLLNNCDDGRWGNMGSDELAWLEQDLRSTSAEKVFVFMHFPVWEPERVAAEYHLLWRDTLHPLFRAARVKAVFGGHAHCYGPTRELDGIRYFVSGGGGAELRPEYRRAGGEHHFMKVSVTGGGFDVRVVTQHGELTDVEADLMGGFLFAEKHSSRIGIPRGAQTLEREVAFEVSLNNPYSAPLLGRAWWEADANHFEVKPAESAVRVRPGQTAQFHFTLKALKPDAPLETLPWLAFDVSGGGHRERFNRQVLFLDQLEVHRREAPPIVDGNISEWAGTNLIRLSGGGKAAASLQCLHDTKSLYLAVDVPATESPLNEDSAFRDLLQLGFAARVGDTGFGGETLRIGLQPNGTGVEVGDRTPGHGFGKALTGVKAASRTASGRRTFELSLPKTLLPRYQDAADKRMVMSISFPVPERGDVEPEEPGPGSFSYQVRYGGDAFVPVNFVELILVAK